MAEGKSDVLRKQRGIEHIVLEAPHRWFRPAEVCEILRNHKKFLISQAPANKPPSGSLFLFDRKVLRYFRKDGHNWRKKKDGKTVKEAHEKLKDGSVDVLHCYYAHGEENEKFQRRSYWMLEEELSHIVLVHYRDVKGTRPNFKYTKNSEEALPYAHYIDNTMPSMEMDTSLLSSVHPNSYQVTSQTMDTASMSSALAAENDEAESAFNHHTTSQLYSFLEKTDDAKLSDTYHHLPYLNEHGKLSHTPGVDCSSLGQANQTENIDNAGLIYEPQKNIDFLSWEDILKNNAGIQPVPFHQSVPEIQPNAMGRKCNSSQGDEASARNSSQLPSWPTNSVHTGSVSEISSTHCEQEVNEVDCHYSFVHPDKQNKCLGKNDTQEKLLNEKDNYKVKSEMETSTSMDEMADDTYFTLTKTLLDGPTTAEGLKKLDSFNRWISKELAEVDELDIQPTSGAYCDIVESKNGVDSTTFSPHVHLDADLLHPSVSYCQHFSIIDFSPSWTYENSTVKVLISGKFLRSQQEVENCNWSCMFGEVEVPAEIISNGVLRCHTPLHKAGRVPFYVTCSNRIACSEVREFNFQVNHIQDVSMTNENRGNVFEILNKRFGELLSLGSAFPQHLESMRESEKFQLGRKISSLLREESDKWDILLKLSFEKDSSPEDIHEQLLQKLLKEKLLEWLLQKITEDGKGPSILDEGGQGVLHLAAALGYDWALQPTIVSGVNINFRDIHGWTALHWAAFCGRERTVVSLISLGAAPGLLTDPCPEYPSGRTPADLASANGHKGIAGYLAESDLSTHLLSLNLNREGGTEESCGAKELQSAQTQNKITFHEGDISYGLSLKDSLAAVCNATQAAARIHQVFRVQSFQRKQLEEYSDDKIGISDEDAISLITVKSHKTRQHDEPVHAAAIQIQKKFRSWKGRKDFLIIRQQIVKIQAHVRGHQVRKNYRKIVWSVGIVEKVILRWRRKRCGLRGFKSEAIEGNMVRDMPSKEDDYDFLKEGRKQTEERTQKALARVKSMVQYPEARDQYRRLLTVVNEVHQTQVNYDRSLHRSNEINECGGLIDHEALLDEDTYMPTA